MFRNRYSAPPTRVTAKTVCLLSVAAPSSFTGIEDSTRNAGSSASPIHTVNTHISVYFKPQSLEILKRR